MLTVDRESHYLFVRGRRGADPQGCPPLIRVRSPDDVFVVGRTTAVSIRDRVFFTSNFEISAEVHAEGEDMVPKVE